MISLNLNFDGKTVEELQTELAETRLQLKRLKFAHAVEKLKNTAQITFYKKEVARILTELRARELKKS